MGLILVFAPIAPLGLASLLIAFRLELRRFVSQIGPQVERLDPTVETALYAPPLNDGKLCEPFWGAPPGSAPANFASLASLCSLGGTAVLWVQLSLAVPGSDPIRCNAQTWLILPVVICLSQRLSHACLSISFYTAKLRMAH